MLHKKPYILLSSRWQGLLAWRKVRKGSLHLSSAGRGWCRPEPPSQSSHSFRPSGRHRDGHSPPGRCRAPGEPPWGILFTLPLSLEHCLERERQLHSVLFSDCHTGLLIPRHWQRIHLKSGILTPTFGMRVRTC